VKYISYKMVSFTLQALQKVRKRTVEETSLDTTAKENSNDTDVMWHAVHSRHALFIPSGLATHFTLSHVFHIDIIVMM